MSSFERLKSRQRAIREQFPQDFGLRIYRSISWLTLPFSREAALLEWLKRSVALYRLAFGQPRQDDLLTFLRKLDDSEIGIDLQELQINLRPWWPQKVAQQNYCE